MTASLLAFGSYPWICENVARAACTLWSRGSWLGGALVSGLCFCCFLAHRLLYGSFAVCCFALVFPCHTNPWGDTMLSSLLARFNCLWTDQLTTGRVGFCCVFWVFVGVVVFLVFVCLPLCFARWQLNGLCIDPSQFSFVCTLSSWLMLPLH